MDSNIVSALEDAAAAEDAQQGAPSEDVMFLGGRLELLKMELDQIERRKKDVQAEYDLIRKTRLPDAMRAAGMVRNDKGSFTLKSGAKVSLRTDLHVGVRADDRDMLYAWLRERGDNSLIAETVHPSTLKAHCRDLIKNGVQLPRFISQFNETAATITRGRKEEESE